MQTTFEVDITTGRPGKYSARLIVDETAIIGPATRT